MAKHVFATVGVTFGAMRAFPRIVAAFASVAAVCGPRQRRGHVHQQHWTAVHGVWVEHLDATTAVAIAITIGRTDHMTITIVAMTAVVVNAVALPTRSHLVTAAAATTATTSRAVAAPKGRT